MLSRNQFPFDIDRDIRLDLLRPERAQDFLHEVNRSRTYLDAAGSPWLERVQCLNDVLTYFQQVHACVQERSKFNLMILYKNTFVGEIKFHTFDWDLHATELGYWLGQSYQGIGLATKALDALMQILHQHDHVNLFEAHTDAGNDKSQRVLKRLHFTSAPFDKASRLMDRHNKQGLYHRFSFPT